MFLCGLFKGEGKIAELTANWHFCMDAHIKSEILFKNPYALVHQMNYIEKDEQKYCSNYYLIKYIYKMNNWLADFFRECKIVITQIYNLFIALVKIEICA